MDEVVGKWFVAVEVQMANLRVSGNVAPNVPQNERVPDTAAHHRLIRDQQAAGESVDHTIQRYPFGRYASIEIGFPIQVRLWRVLTPRVGVG